MAIVKDSDVESAIAKIQFAKLGLKTTVGCATLTNGFEIIESASCVNPKDYNDGIGQGIVKERINHKVWELLGFKSQDENAKKNPEQKPVSVSEDEAFKED